MKAVEAPTSAVTHIQKTAPGPPVAIAPLLILLSFAGQSLGNAAIACGIFFTLWSAYTVYLFRRRIFKKRFANSPVAVWTDEA